MFPRASRAVTLGTHTAAAPRISRRASAFGSHPANDTRSIPCARARRLATLISAVRDRTRSGDDNHSCVAAKSALQRNLHVADHFDCTADNSDQDPLYQTGHAIIGRPRYPGAGPHDLLRRQASLNTRLMDRARERITRACLAYAHNIAAGAAAGCQH